MSYLLRNTNISLYYIKKIVYLESTFQADQKTCLMLMIIKQLNSEQNKAYQNKL